MDNLDEKHRVVAIIEVDVGSARYMPLLLKKDGKTWEFPGGEINEDESPIKAMIREIGEETGFPEPGIKHLKWDADGIHRHTFQKLEGNSGEFGMHTTPFYVPYHLNQLPAFEPRNNPPEHNDLIWIQLDPWEKETERKTINSLREQIKGGVLMLLNTEQEKVYRFNTEFDSKQSDREITISEVTRMVLERFMTWSFMDVKKP